MAVSAAAGTSWKDRKFRFDPSKPRWIQVASLLTQIFAMLGGLVVALISMFLYPMLLTGSGFALVYLGPVALAFLATLPFRPQSWFTADMPAAVRLQVRLGMGLFGGAWFIGLFAMLNGYNTPLIEREVPMVYKRTSTPRDPKHMSYYIGARVLPSSKDVYEVVVPKEIYESVDLPATQQWHIPHQQLYAMPDRGALRVTVGRGRFGVDWLNSVGGPVTSSTKSYLGFVTSLSGPP